MLGSHESTFYLWPAAFYGMKLSRRVKKLLSFEGRPSDIFTIEIYRRNLVKIWCFWSIFFSFFTLGAQKLVQMVESDKFWQNLVISLVKMKNFDKNDQILAIFHETWFQNYASIDFFFKNEARKQKCGLVVSLYGI